MVLSLALALGVAAISLFILGMESLLGMAGLGIGAVLMMFVANLLSGLAAGWHWLPQPWGFIGQLLPLGGGAGWGDGERLTSRRPAQPSASASCAST